MESNIVYYKTNKKWKKLKHLNYTFDSMENAIKFIRHQYSIIDFIPVKLKILVSDGVKYWDNY